MVIIAKTRQILREAGPNVGASRSSVGGIAIAVLNNGLRPFLSKWHPLLQMWEAQRAQTTSPVEYERNWDHALTLRGELESLRNDLAQYAKSLASIAGIEE